MTNEEAREHMDMLIAHKDKALETHPYFKRCDTCTHSEEQDGSNCYECIKGIADNFEAQPTDKVKYNYTTEEIAKSFIEDVEAVKDQLDGQPCEDCISRSELLRHQHIIYDDDEEGYRAVYVKDIKALPSVTPTSEDIKEAYLKGYDYGVKDWFKSKTQPSEDAVSRKKVIILIDEASEIHPYKVVGDYDTYADYNQGWSDACDWLYANIEGIPSVTPERQKGKWIHKMQIMSNPYTYKCSVCKGWEKDKTKYCPNCGAYMSGGGEDEDRKSL